MKAYTDLEQSKRLVEILPLKSADMTWEQITQDLTGDFTWEPAMGLNEAITYNLFSFKKGYILPCWSLAALLEVINDDYYTTLYHDGVAWNITAIHHDNVKDKHNVYANTPVDACVTMIELLHEQKLL